MDIDDKVLDVDFRKDPRYTAGALTIPKSRLAAAPRDLLPEIPESQWREEADKLDAAGGGLDRLITRVFDQEREGSCVANMATQMHQVIQAAQFGKERVIQLSPISLYIQIGDSPNSGAMVDDALKEGSRTGILPLDIPENRSRFKHLMPATGFYTKYPPNWKDTAVQFRFDESFIIQSVSQMFTRLFRGFPVGVGRDGHSILYLRPVWRNNQWMIKYINSWSDEWGESFLDLKGGFGYDSVRLFKESAEWAFAVRSIVTPDIFNLAA